MHHMGRKWFRSYHIFVGRQLCSVADKRRCCLLGLRLPFLHAIDGSLQCFQRGSIVSGRQAPSSFLRGFPRLSIGQRVHRMDSGLPSESVGQIVSKRLFFTSVSAWMLQSRVARVGDVIAATFAAGLSAAAARPSRTLEARPASATTRSISLVVTPSVEYRVTSFVLGLEIVSLRLPDDQSRGHHCYSHCHLRTVVQLFYW